MIHFYDEALAVFNDPRFQSDDATEWDDLLAELIEDFGEEDGAEVWHIASTMLLARLVDSHRRSRVT